MVSSLLAAAVPVAEIVKEPTSYVEPMESENSVEWLETMVDEMESLLENGTWDLVKLPLDRKVVRWK